MHRVAGALLFPRKRPEQVRSTGHRSSFCACFGSTPSTQPKLPFTVRSLLVDPGIWRTVFQNRLMMRVRLVYSVFWFFGGVTALVITLVGQIQMNLSATTTALLRGCFDRTDDENLFRRGGEAHRRIEPVRLRDDHRFGTSDYRSTYIRAGLGTTGIDPPLEDDRVFRRPFRYQVWPTQVCHRCVAIAAPQKSMQLFADQVFLFSDSQTSIGWLTINRKCLQRNHGW